jgi:hypothetical protein
MLERKPKFQSQTSDADRFADFISKLCDCTDKGKIAEWGGAVLVHRIGEQLLRGMQVKFEGSNRAKADKKPYVIPSWTTVQQTQEQIRQIRSQLDQTHPIRQIVQQQVTQMQSQYAPQVAYPTAPPAPPQYAPPQYVQPQPQYQQPQYAPQGQPQYVQQQAPIQAPAQPAQPAPAGYPVPGNGNPYQR